MTPSFVRLLYMKNVYDLTSSGVSTDIYSNRGYWTIDVDKNTKTTVLKLDLGCLC